MRTTNTRSLIRWFSALFSLSIEVSDTPLGPKLGDLNGPAPAHQFLNVSLRVILSYVVYGHVELF